MKGRVLVAAAAVVLLGGCGGDPSHHPADLNAGAPIDPHDHLNYDCAPPGPDGTLYDGIDSFVNGGSSTVVFTGRAWLRDPKDIRLLRAGFVAGPDSFRYGLGYTWPKPAVPAAGFRLKPGEQASLVIQVTLAGGKSGISPGPDVAYTSGGTRYTYHSPIAVAMKKGGC